MNTRTVKIAGCLIAGLCFLRAMSASGSVFGGDEVEVYSATESSDGEVADTDEENGRSEIRLSRPEDAALRTAQEDQGYDQVPGADRLTAENAIAVPRKTDRKIASSSATPAPANAPAPTASAASKVSVEPMEPKASYSSSDVHPETIAPSALPPQQTGGRVGVRSEPRFETRIDPPVPRNGSTPGVQEISLIVSDYGYFPQRIFVTQNVPVKVYLTTTSKVTMCFMQDNWGLKKGVVPGKVEELVFTPNESGDYRFYCPVKSIEGKITVREAPTADQPNPRTVAAEKTEVQTAEAPRNAPRNSRELRQLIEEE